MTYNLFVDESCHLERDRIPVMCIGYVKVPQIKYEVLRKQLAALKSRHMTHAELKWNKFSESRLPLYRAAVDFFFENPIDFRCVLIKHKERLRYQDLNRGSHDNFYYKMIYYLLRPNPPDLKYRIFMDIKDTRGKEKLRKIEEVFTNLHRGESPFIHFQHLRSNENEFFQLTDLFIGAITFKARGLTEISTSNHSKIDFVNYLEKTAGYSLDEAIPLWETKFNIFDFQPKKR